MSRLSPPDPPLSFAHGLRISLARAVLVAASIAMLGLAHACGGSSGEDDELFFLEFASTPRLRQQWTKNRESISRAVQRVRPAGGTAMYDAVADAL